MIAVAAGLSLWWCALVALLMGSTLLALLQPWLAGGRAGNTERPAVSVLVPLREQGEVRSEANEALAMLAYPRFDVLFSLRRGSPSEQSVDVLFTTPRPGWNPKLANLVEPAEAAANDLLLIKDAATFLPPRALSEMVASLVPGVGLVCAVPVARRPCGLIAHVEASLINLHGARLLLALSALGGGAGIGAAMLVRRSDLKAAGGMEAIAPAIADDHALARLLARGGLRTVFAGATVDQMLDRRLLGAVWRRHLRWAICRRLEEPRAFFVEPFTGLLAAGIASFGLAFVSGMPAGAMLAVTLLLWLGIETLLAAAKGWPLSWLTPPAILLREMAQPVLWLHALLARRIVWGASSIPIPARRP